MIHTHKRLKERFLIRQNRTKRANFRGSPLFQATYNIKTEKKPQLIQLILCHLGVGGWRNDWKKKDFLENEHILSCFVRIKSSFNLLWVLDFFFFSKRWLSTLFQILLLSFSLWARHDDDSADFSHGIYIREDARVTGYQKPCFLSSFLSPLITITHSTSVLCCY